MGLEFLIAFSLATGVLFTGVAVFNPADNYIRFALLATSGGAACLAAFTALGRPSDRFGRVPLLAIIFLTCVMLQEFQQSGWLKTLPYLIAILLSIAATRADLTKLMRVLPSAFLVAVVGALLPAVSSQGFSAGRQWLPGMPGRYFGFSNPDALGFLAGLGVLVSLPSLRRFVGLMLFFVSSVLFTLSAAYTSLAGLAVAGLIVAAARLRPALRLGAIGVRLLATVSIVALAWLPTQNALAFFTWLHLHASLTNRTLIWLQLVQLTDTTDYFWTGLGDQQVATYTLRIYGVGSAHTTLLQLMLSKGFVTATSFVLLMLLVATTSLRRAERSRSRDSRIALGLLAFWFVTSLASIETANALVVAFVIVMASANAESGSVDQEDITPAGTERESDATKVPAPARVRLRTAWDTHPHHKEYRP